MTLQFALDLHALTETRIILSVFPRADPSACIDPPGTGIDSALTPIALVTPPEVSTTCKKRVPQTTQNSCGLATLLSTGGVNLVSAPGNSLKWV